MVSMLSAIDLETYHMGAAADGRKQLEDHRRNGETVSEESAIETFIQHAKEIEQANAGQQIYIERSKTHIFD